MLCKGGCGLMARNGCAWYQNHRPACPPRRLCACGCGTEFQPAYRDTKILKGHLNKKNYPERMCEVCDKPLTGSSKPSFPYRRHKQCYVDTCLKGEDGSLSRWMRENPEQHRQQAAANAREGHKRFVRSEPVRRVIAARGIRYQDIAKDFGITKEYARNLVHNYPRHRFMAKEMAERLLRYASGMPFKPTRQQQMAASRADMTFRKRKERRGEPVRTNPSIIARGIKADLKATEHLKDVYRA